jgi:hypothetical protein
VVGSAQEPLIYFIEGCLALRKSAMQRCKSPPYLGIDDDLRLACHFFQDHSLPRELNQCFPSKTVYLLCKAARGLQGDSGGAIFFDKNSDLGDGTP